MIFRCREYGQLSRHWYFLLFLVLVFLGVQHCHRQVSPNSRYDGWLLRVNRYTTREEMYRSYWGIQDTYGFLWSRRRIGICFWHFFCWFIRRKFLSKHIANLSQFFVKTLRILRRTSHVSRQLSNFSATKQVDMEILYEKYGMTWFSYFQRNSVNNMQDLLSDGILSFRILF